MSSADSKKSGDLAKTLDQKQKVKGTPSVIASTSKSNPVDVDEEIQSESEGATVKGPAQVDEWLIRTSTNWVAGPYPKTEICRMIQEAKLAPEDEVCEANGFWTYLHERQEILQLLGVEAPRSPSTEEDVTETQILPSDGAPAAAATPSKQEDLAKIPLSKRFPRGAPSSAAIKKSPGVSTESVATSGSSVHLSEDPIKPISGGAASNSDLGPDSKSDSQAEQETSGFVQKIHVVGDREQLTLGKGILWLLLGLGFILLVAFVVNALKI